MTARNKKAKVLHIITNLPVGGAQDNTLITVERLDRRKYDVTLVCSSDGAWVRRALQIQGLHLIFVDELTRKIRALYDFVAFWRIFKIIRSGRYTIVHTHSSKPGVLGRVAARLAGVPVVVHTIHGFPFHDYMHPLVRGAYILIERFVSRLTDKLVTVSKLNLEKAVELKLGPRAKFANVYSGIDFSKFDVQVDVSAKKQELGIMNGEKIVGMVGRFSQQKAPLDFIKAVAEVLRRRNDVRFVLVGDGELKQQMYELAEKLNVDSRLLFLGFREDVPELLQVLDVFVLTSLWEGLGRSLTEAMYTGRPVVATRVEGVPELVQDGKTGILVEPRNVQAIAEGIIKLLEDEHQARKLGCAARQRINEDFEADRMVRQLERLYNQLIEKKERGARLRHV